MKKTLSLIMALIMAITCVIAIPATAYANKIDDCETIEVGGTISATITEKSDLKSDLEFYAKFVPTKTGYYEFWTENNSKLKGKEAVILCAIVEVVKGEEETISGLGVLSNDPTYTELLGDRGLRVAAKLTKGKTYYFALAGSDYGTFTTEVHVKSGHDHSYEAYVYPAYCDSETPDFAWDGSKGKTCSLCGDDQTLETYYYPKKVELSATVYTYNGKAKKPKVTVKDRKGNVISSKNYTVKYSSNKNVGTAKVTIVFNDKKYSGELAKTFTINPVKTGIKKLSAIKKGFKVTWTKKTTQVDGYQVKYSTSSKMTGAKTVSVKGAKNTSKEIKSLKGGKKYFVQVRTYKKVSGKTYYSDWSAISKVTTKKESSSTTKSSSTVYVTPTGKCYHRIKDCGNGSYSATSLSNAKSRGLKPCSKCY